MPNYYIYLTLTVLLLALWGIYHSERSIIMYIVNLEILFVAINVNFVTGSVMLGEIVGVLCVMVTLSIAGCETAVGLGILLIMYSRKLQLSVEHISSIKSA